MMNITLMMIMMMVAVDVNDNDDDGNNDDDDFYKLSLHLLFNIYLTAILRFWSTKKKRRKRKIKNQLNRRQVFRLVLFFMTASMWQLISSKFDFLYRGIITKSESWCWYLIWYLSCDNLMMILLMKLMMMILLMMLMMMMAVMLLLLLLMLSMPTYPSLSI